MSAAGHTSALLLVLLLGCSGTATTSGGDPLGSGGGSGSAGGQAAVAGQSSSSAAGATGTDPALPCAVAAMLAKNCWACHGAVPRGTPMSLATYQDLVAASLTAPSQSNAQLALARMQDPTRPMPPTGLPAAADVQTLQAWLTAGMPKSGCTNTMTPIAPSPYDTPTVCTSSSTWTNGNEGSDLMHPGAACINCHNMGEGPKLVIAGTVYPTAHEPDDCNGASLAGKPSITTAVVTITDATGKASSLPVNSAGNFSLRSRTALAFPFTAKVDYAGATRLMQHAQTVGDCNTCHTEAGTSDAPGRIMLP
jgi:hypothetical protein